jgi:hypothetical protein
MESSNLPAIGLHRGVPFEDYLAWDALSNSRLGLLAKSPAHFRAGFGEATAAMRLGSLVHGGVLEPGAVKDRYVVQPDFHTDPRNHVVVKGKKGEPDKTERSYSASSKWAIAQKAEWTAVNRDREIVTQSQYESLVGVAMSIYDNNKALKLFESGEAEVSVFWIERVDFDGHLVDVPCKARIDWLSLPDYFVDLKTTEDVSDFEWSIKKFGYPRQVAWYQRGLAAVGCGVLAPHLIACEKNTPYCSRAAKCSDAMIKDGNASIAKLLRTYVECQFNDSWPGYPNPEEWGTVENRQSDSDFSEWFSKSVNASNLELAS